MSFFIKGLIRKAKSILAEGLVVIEAADPEIAKWRFSICQQCIHYKPETTNPKLGKCMICTCLLPEKAESLTNRSEKRLSGEVTHCPKGLWEDLEVANFYREQDGLDPIVKY